MVDTQSLSRTTRLAFRVLAAKQNITKLGYPEIISKLFYEKYGNLAPLIAKWYKQYTVPESWSGNDWWRTFTWNYKEALSLYALTHVYEHSEELESFIEACNKMEISIRKGLTQQDLDLQRGWIVNRIRDGFFGQSFFKYYSLIQDIESGKLKDISPYKKLRFLDAQQKYEKRQYFQESTPLKVYDNGFKWIDVGQKSALLNEKMKNCGSVGLMSLDKNATIIALFGPNGKPHVMVTYSPNDKRISGDQCAGSTEVKPQYHQYVIDLADHLGATFAAMHSKSMELGLKYRLRNKAQSLEKLNTSEYSSESYFKFISDGKVFYTNGYSVISEDEIRRASGMIDRGELNVPYPQKEIFNTLLLSNNRYPLNDQGIHIVPLFQFLEEVA